MAINNIKCVIFDCDGTLVDSERLCCQALVNVFNRWGAQLTLKECVSNFKGGKLADILNETQKLKTVNVSIDALETEYRHEVKKLFESHLQPMDGIKRLLQFFDAHNIEYCVVSNGPREKIEYVLELTELLDLFTGKVFSAFDANSWKPEPDLIMYCVMNMGFLPSECLYIDDTPKGVEAGLNAGIKTVQLFNGEAVNRMDDERVIQIRHLDELKEQFLGCSF